MTAPEYNQWLTNVFKQKDKQRLLAVDSYRPHVSEESADIVKSRCNADLVIIPGGCTAIAQPMDRCINHPFKQRMREQWQE